MCIKSKNRKPNISAARFSTNADNMQLKDVG